MNVKRLEISVLMAFIMLVLVGQVSSFANSCDDIRENTLRLHIIANSDSACDQNIKLKVRDFVLENYGEKLSENDDLIDAKINTELMLEDIESSINKELEEKGVAYKSKAKLVNMYFNTRYYDDFTMAAGKYDALRIVLGEGKGKNWWCVMYPPLCLGTSVEKFKGAEEIKAVSEKYKYIPKFAIVELIEKIKDKL